MRLSFQIFFYTASESVVLALVRKKVLSLVRFEDSVKWKI